MYFPHTVQYQREKEISENVRDHPNPNTRIQSHSGSRVSDRVSINDRTAVIIIFSQEFTMIGVNFSSQFYIQLYKAKTSLKILLAFVSLSSLMKDLSRSSTVNIPISSNHIQW